MPVDLVILPLRLDAWNPEGTNLITSKTKNGETLESREFLDTDGEPVLAVEDGEIQITKGDRGTASVTLLSDNEEGTSWVYSGINPSVREGDVVQAGDEIGRVKGTLRLFFSDDQETFAGDSKIPIPQDPLPRLDDLNALPHPDDIDADIDTADERRALSESLFTGQGRGKMDPKTKKLLTKGAYIAGGGLALYGLYKLLK